MKFYFKLFLLFSLFVASSCVKDLDFNQAEDLVITPEVAVSLVKSTLNQNQLVVGGMEVTSLSQTSEFTAFDNSIAQEDLRRILFQFEAINTFDRDFTIDFIFYDEFDVETYRIPTLVINANDDEFSMNDEVIIANTPRFLESTQIEVQFNLMPSSDGSTLDPNVPDTLTFKSAGIFYFTIN
jgi:hypothetical protein